MKTGEQTISEVDELIRFAVSLVRAHYEPDEAVVEKYSVDAFNHTCDELSKFLDKRGNCQASRYIRVLCGLDKNVFVPM